MTARALGEPSEGALARILGALFGPLGGAEGVPEGPAGPVEPAGRTYRAGGRSWEVERCAAGDVLHVADGLERLRKRSGARGDSLPLIAAPFMGEVAKDLCAREGVGWLDLCGNARITAPGLYIQVDGKPNRFRRAGRPPSLFAPQRAHVARMLLANPTRFFPQRVLSIWTGVAEAYTSRIVRNLEKARLVERNGRGEVRAARPKILLEALRENYRYLWSDILHARVEAESPEALLQSLPEKLQSGGKYFHYAVTGQAAAWLRMGAPDFEVATVILRTPVPTPAEWEEMGVRMTDHEPNLIFLVTDDRNVFREMDIDSPVRSAHPHQIYLDLLAQPEPDPETAELVRRTFLDFPR